MTDIEDRTHQPDIEEMISYVGIPLFSELCAAMERDYRPQRRIEYSDEKGFIRYYGKAVFDDDPALFRKACEEADYIPKMYNDRTGRRLRMFYLGEAAAELRNLAGMQESLAM